MTAGLEKLCIFRVRHLTGADLERVDPHPMDWSLVIRAGFRSHVEPAAFDANKRYHS